MTQRRYEGPWYRITYYNSITGRIQRDMDKSSHDYISMMNDKNILIMSATRFDTFKEMRLHND